MLEVYGHAEARAQLERELPVVTLLRGPDSVGKWTLACYLSEYHGFAAVDLRTYPKLDMEAARSIVAFAQRAPFGKLKAVIAQLDGASPSTLATLLKLLEEPPPQIRFMLIASRPVLDTVISRATLVNLGLLSPDEVFAVLNSRLGMRPEQARTAAELSRGQVGPALRIGEMDASKAKVLTVIKALADHDPGLLDKVLMPGAWGQVEHALFQAWAVEAATGRWRMFRPEDSAGLQSTVMPRRVLVATSHPAFADARPPLALRVALAPLLSV